MFSSLRSRLWLSYALLISVSIGVVAVTLLVAFLRNPLVYRSGLPLLREAMNAAQPRVERALAQGMAAVEKELQTESQRTGLRYLLVAPPAKLLYDSGKGNEGGISLIALRRLMVKENEILSGLFRDQAGTRWLYLVHHFPEGTALVIAMPTRQLPLNTLIRNEMVMPVMLAGLCGLGLSVVLAFSMGAWITRPLQKMQKEALQLADGKAVQVSEEGPLEVRNLAHTLNEMMRKVQASQRAQRDFIANVSHDLKTPLTAVQGFAQAILDGTAQSPEALKDAALVIYNEASRMYRLVLDLLTLARFETGTADLVFEKVDVQELLRETVRRFSPQAQKAGIYLQLSVSPLPVLIADGERLMQALSNLLDNALKYTPSGGTVWVRGMVEGEHLLLEVQDTGKGIPLEEQERIFERFYRGNRSRSQNGEQSSGLGLPIVREIVHAHGGEVRVSSEPGKGSRFTLVLPLYRSDIH
ncbi:MULTISPECIES: cell wall metabolism sensor histidine kinase WalK [Anaerolinea]|uniref:sensor histidine kinase n=1 Tax=Anaerolinea TaxID=233189 RepID=UPI002611BF3F|nr:HAMP domain-containing sensor histidine kinase [Anaerolinea thermophila]